MPFCKNCGMKLEPDAAFCHECGTPASKTKSSKLEVKETIDDFKTRVLGKTPSYGVLSLENLPEGHVIDERYKIKVKLGQGGFGAVYLAYDHDMNIEKALKVIPEAIVNDKEAMFDLQKEAQTMIALNHPNIVRVYDFHRTGSIKYIDMEYIDGKTLTEIKLEYPDKKVPEDKVKDYALNVAEGLAFAHSKNVIHKDIKPQNVMITKDGEVKLMDFGIAETVRTSMSRIQNTSSSGTLVYMSPEQLLGKDVGKESDIYSFGAMLYELLSGHPPFYKGDINYQILNEQPEQLKNVSKKMNNMLMKCLEKEYKNRFKSFAKIISALGGSYRQEKKTFLNNEISRPAGIKKLVSVTLSTEPKNAEVTIAGKTISSDSFKLPEGSHQIYAKKEGYKAINSEIIVSENSKNDFFIELESVMGSIRIEADKSDLSILMNGKETGKKTPFVFENIIPDIDYEIEIEGEEFYSDPVNIRIKERENKLHNPNLKHYPTIEGMIFVKGSTFKMGSNDGEACERPIHSVTLSNFYIGKYEVTQKEWKEIMNSNPSYFKEKKVIEKGFLGIGRVTEEVDNLPVEEVRWYDAVEFCNKISRKKGLTPCYSGSGKNITCDFNANGYRLPTEAEWEYAARGGNKSKGYIYSGSNTISNVAWYYDNSRSKTNKVGTKQPNELGIYDMSGNVWEWCNDWYDSNYYSNSPQNNPKGPSSGSYRVLRGGSLYHAGDYFCRVARRFNYYPVSCGSFIGFRFLRTLK